MNTPTHAFSLWTTYDITPRFQIGGGAFYNSEVYGDVPNTGAGRRSWWRFDVMAAYKVTRTRRCSSTSTTSPTSSTTLGVFELGGARAGRTAALTYRIRFTPDDRR